MQAYRSQYGYSGLQIFADYGHQGIVALLLEAGMIDELVSGTTALHAACRERHLEVVQTLLKAKSADNKLQIMST